MDNLLNSKFEHSQPGSGEGAAPRKLLERDSRALLVPPKNPATSAPYFNGGASPRQGQLDPGTGLLSPHPADGLGPTATASLTLGITASYSIVAQDPHARHPPAAVVTCACGASDDCKLGYYHGGQGAGCCCYERRGEAPRKQDTAPSPTKPILKFSVSAILGADSVKTPPCTDPLLHANGPPLFGYAGIGSGTSIAKPIPRPAAAMFNPHLHTLLACRHPYLTVSTPNSGGSGGPGGSSGAPTAVFPLPGTFPWANSSRGKPRRGMMRRAVFSDLQRKGLEKRFQIQKYISKPDRKKLAEKLGLKDSQARTTFH
ncbi:homeobox protein DBX1-like [Periplaneta americana]|uniref:homeobox protein DBX1-like n=1 Tax=Periplaneta americana TaxID=6978 RepID=UPI0037E9929F